MYMYAREHMLLARIRNKTVALVLLLRERQESGPDLYDARDQLVWSDNHHM